MFKAGHIYYFSSFNFNNGDNPKEKYFIVLKDTEKGFILGTLPTRSNKIPAFVDKEHGCININERMYNCYLFNKGQVVCKNGFCFDLPTFVYGSDIDYYDKARFESDHPNEGVDYVLQGELTDNEFKALIDCFLNSDAVKRGIKRVISK